MNKIIKLLGVPCLAAMLVLAGTVAAGDTNSNIGAAVYNEKGELQLPEGFREWVFIGAPLTPNGLNNGQAGFPEFHHVYVNPDSFAVYQKTGVFPDGTVIAKELLLLKEGDYKDGSKNAPSGRGFFAGKYNGLDVMVKDSRRYGLTNDWGFFNFGHKAPPYAKQANAAAQESCAGCHAAGAEKDMVFMQFYPILQKR